jgi:hypothetical protein
MSIKEAKCQLGFSLVEGLIGLFILAMLVTSHMKLMSYIMTGPNQGEGDELLDQLSRISETISSRVSRGGGYLDSAGQDKGIQVCAMDTGGSQCNSYSGTPANLCMSLPTQVGNGALARIDIRGFRLVNGQLQQKGESNVNMSLFNFQQFCTSSGWENLNDPAEFRITTLKFCRFNASSMSAIRQDYNSNCPGILSNSSSINMFWLAMLTASSSKVGGATVEQTRVIQLFNETKVTTP